MGVAKERRDKARANRKASLEARYGTGIMFPNPEGFNKIGRVVVTEQKAPSRPSSSITIARNRQGLKDSTVRAKERK